MRDCTSCRHSVANDPRMRGREYAMTPCASCTLASPQWEPLHNGQVHYGQAFEDTPSNGTWKYEPTWEAGRAHQEATAGGEELGRYLLLSKRERRRIRLRARTGVVARFCAAFSPGAEDLLAHRHQAGHSWTYTTLAQGMGWSVQRLHKRFRHIDREVAKWREAMEVLS